MIRALIFDFDGLILETEVAVLRAMQEMFEAHGGHLPPEVWVTSIGSSDSFDPYAYLAEQIGRPVSRDDLRAQFRGRLRELVQDEQLLPGVLAYLDEAKALGLQIAVASSSPRDWVEGHLTTHGLMSYFHCTRCSDDVKQTKPNPELFLTALDALGVAASEAIVLEDSPNGVAAANKAGIFVVAVPGPLTRDFAFEKADYRLSSLEEMPLRDLIAIAESRMATP